jgi:hypothetical protein
MNEFRQQIAAALWIIAANGEGLGIATRAALLGGNIEQANEPRPPGQWRNLAANFLATVIFESLPHPHSEPIQLNEFDRFPERFDLHIEPCKRVDPQVESHLPAQACNPDQLLAGAHQCRHKTEEKFEPASSQNLEQEGKQYRVIRIFPFGVKRNTASTLCQQMQAALEIMYCHGEVPFSTKTYFYGDKKTARSVQDRRQVLIDAIAFWHRFETLHHQLDGLKAIPLEQLRINKYGYSCNPKFLEELTGE